MLSRISKSELGTETANASGTGTDTASTANKSDKIAAADVVFYLVRKNWNKPNTQIAAFTKIENAENCVNCNPGYAAFDEAGNQIYPHSPNTPNKL